MKRSKKKALMRSTALAAAITAAAVSGISASAAGWINAESGSSRWMYTDENGQLARSCWKWIDGNGDGIAECYYFDANGIMLSDTVTPDGYIVNSGGAWTEGGVVRSVPVKSLSNGPGAMAEKPIGWKQQTDGTWVYLDADGSRFAGGWRWIDGNGDGVAECYYFNTDGIMLANTITPDGYRVDGNGAWTDSSGSVQTKNSPSAVTGVSSKGIGGGGSSGGGGGSSSGGGGASSGGGESSGGSGSSSGSSSSGGGSTSSGSDITPSVPDIPETPPTVETDPSNPNPPSGSDTENSGNEDMGAGDNGSENTGSGNSGTGGSGIENPGTENPGTGDAGDEDPGTEAPDAPSDEKSAVISSFVEENINDEMSDFEKEMTIIRYLTENTVYNAAGDTGDNGIHSSYGALVDGEAVCDGLAYAFRELAEASGLEAKCIGGGLRGSGDNWTAHMWNQVKLDGHWYNLDLTKEVSNILASEYPGFKKVRNKAINVPDSEFYLTRNPLDDPRYETEVCDSEDYNWNTNEYYLITGEEIIDISADDVRRAALGAYVSETSDGHENVGWVDSTEESEKNLLRAGNRFDDGSNYFENITESSSDALADYLNRWFSDGYQIAVITTNYGNDLSWIDDDWLREKVSANGGIVTFGYESTTGNEYNYSSVDVGTGYIAVSAGGTATPEATAYSIRSAAASEEASADPETESDDIESDDIESDDIESDDTGYAADPEENADYEMNSADIAADSDTVIGDSGTVDEDTEIVTEALGNEQESL